MDQIPGSGVAVRHAGSLALITMVIGLVLAGCQSTGTAGRAMASA